jgi:hypothetical protein
MDEAVGASPVNGFVGRVPVIRNLVRLLAGIRAVTSIAETCVKLATSSEAVHQDILRESRPYKSRQGFAYYRFNVERGMESIGLEEWKKMHEIAECTARYMDEEEGREKRNNCARDLIRPPDPKCKFAFS